jgi:hypothetical protein
MQTRELDHATIAVANTTEVSGMATADEVNLDRFHNRIRKVCALVAATLFLPALAYAQNNQGDNQIAVLQAQITALHNRVNALQNQLNAVLSSNVYMLNPYVGVEFKTINGVKGPNIIFAGANIHIRSGSNATDDNGNRIGRGNLIIGYDEAPYLNPDRGGSHNLIIGRFHLFTSSAWGGLVAGEQNTIQNQGTTVSGGLQNIASGQFSSISGGQTSTASGDLSSVSGGLQNTASGSFANVSGGFLNVASGVLASVSGGEVNLASGYNAVVIGGQSNTASADLSIRPQPPFSP